MAVLYTPDSKTHHHHFSKAGVLIPYFVFPLVSHITASDLFTSLKHILLKLWMTCTLLVQQALFSLLSPCSLSTTTKCCPGNPPIASDATAFWSNELLFGTVLWATLMGHFPPSIIGLDVRPWASLASFSFLPASFSQGDSSWSTSVDGQPAADPQMCISNCALTSPAVTLDIQLLTQLLFPLGWLQSTSNSTGSSHDLSWLPELVSLSFILRGNSKC